MHMNIFDELKKKGITVAIMTQTPDIGGDVDDTKTLFDQVIMGPTAELDKDYEALKEKVYLTKAAPEEFYVITDLHGGFWDRHKGQFRGQLFASEYTTRQLALTAAEKIPKKIWFEVKQMYRNE